jgi:hypothetical protein
MTPASRALLRAAADGDAHRLRALLVQGTNVNSTNGAGQTPLMLAAAFNHQDIVNLLLKARANVEIQDDLGLTALDWGTQFPAITELISKSMQPLDRFPAAAKPGEESSQADRAVAFAASAPVQKPTAEVQKPALTGLAGAILRDRKPVAVEEAQSAVSSPENVQRAEVISNPVTAGPARHRLLLMTRLIGPWVQPDRLTTLRQDHPVFNVVAFSNSWRRSRRLQSVKLKSTCRSPNNNDPWLQFSSCSYRLF